MAMVESQFANVETRKRRKSRRMRKNYDVVVLPNRMAKGRFPKGAGFNKGAKADRQPIMGDKLIHDERVIWLRA